MDRLLLKNMRVYGYHGVDPIENEIGRYFEIDAELYFSFDNAAASDDLQQTVDYGEVFAFIRAQFNGNTCKLIETVVVNLAEDIISKFTAVEKVIIRVRKPNPPVGGPMAYAEAQVERSRK